eukprot:1615592-Amphidinium_carterae.1
MTEQRGVVVRAEVLPKLYGLAQVLELDHGFDFFVHCVWLAVEGRPSEMAFFKEAPIHNSLCRLVERMGCSSKNRSTLPI